MYNSCGVTSFSLLTSGISNAGSDTGPGVASTTGSLAGSGIGVDVSVEGTSTTGSEIAGIVGTSGVTGTTGSAGLAAAIWSNILVLSNAGSASAGFTSSFASDTTGIGSCTGAGSAGVCTIVSDVTAGSGVTLTSGVSEGVSIVNELSKVREQLAGLQARERDLAEQLQMAEDAEKMKFIEKNKISLDRLILLNKVSEEEIMRLLKEKEQKEAAQSEEREAYSHEEQEVII